MAHAVGIDHLPTEIVLKLFALLSDLDDLYSLLHASPTFYRLFGDYAVEVLDQVLDKSQQIHESSRQMLRTIAHIRTGDFPATSLSELQDQVTTKVLMTKKDRDEQGGFFPQRLPIASSPSLVRSLLATARQITIQTTDCLAVHLDRFRRLKPFVSTDPNQNRGSRSVQPVFAMTTGRPHPGRALCAVRDIGSPTWGEEQRVYRAFWRVQLLNDLRIAVNTGLITGWSDEEKFKLNELSPIDIYDFEDVAASLCALNAARGGQSYFGYVELVEGGAFLTVTDYLKTSPPALDPNHWKHWSRPWAAAAPKPMGLDPWGVERQMLDRQLCNTIEDYRVAYEADASYQILSFTPYRRLGFSIWCYERLQSYGFTDKNANPDLVAWVSVLGSEDRAVLEKGMRRSEREWPRTTRTTAGGWTFDHVNPVVQWYKALVDDEQ
ncbi:hypothetical protein ANO11243_062320 [Dothideomycetidae sp. 11243]|nr:hypothetical protein ANO11243_062320 [fungal sp. No.11243]